MKKLSFWTILKLGLLVFIPITVWFDLIGFNPVAITVASILGILPLISFIAKATEELTSRTSTIVGSLLNVTFGNAFEIIIGILAIKAGLIGMIKAALAGSIILNILLVIGASMLLSGFKYKEQTFNRESAGIGSTMLLLAVAGLLLPSLYSVIAGEPVVIMSRVVAITLAMTYVLALVFMLGTHRHLFKTKLDVEDHKTHWGIKKSSLVLIVCVGLAILQSEILVSNITPVIEATALTEEFVGMVIIAVIGNIPELLTAITLGIRNNITQSIEIGLNSSMQIALFAAPLLVLLSPLLGSELTLAFSPFQMVGMILAVVIINYLSSDGVCNWLEGLQLTAMYILIAVVFFFIN
ncbi:MAG TPA: calcium/proton exchanger [Dehalococcoidales bacterium]|nr:calcium/proton exchanger [Dehalococcoidales bacterium]